MGSFASAVKRLPGLRHPLARRLIFFHGTAPLRRLRRRLRGGAATRAAPIERHQVPGHETFFGYYDLPPLSADGQRLLALAVPNAVANSTTPGPACVGYFERGDDRRFVPLGETAAWCWQMGCRLRWYPTPSANRAMYNASGPDGYTAVLKTLDGAGDAEVLPFPLYDVAPSGAFGLYLDFARLGWLRPGYGYRVIADRQAHDAQPGDNGIWRADLLDKRSELIVSLAQAAAIAPEPSMAGAHHYFNHLSISPSGRRFLFFHLWVPEIGHVERWRCRLFTANCDGTELRLLDLPGRPSHYAWRDDQHLLVTVVDLSSGRSDYRLVHDGKGDQGLFWPHLPHVDGHPSFSPDGRWLITDTYANAYNEQELLLCREDGVIQTLGAFPPEWPYYGERRCDLHPRWDASGHRVVFDSAHDGGRALYVATTGLN